jgi:two-component system, OmpR family, sensor histidine kinase KdpD
MTQAERGKLKIYMGYAAGVGKTYRMLEDAQALKMQGEDVVLGYFESHGRQATIEKTIGLETVPRMTVCYRGAVFEEMNPDAIMARHPRLCLVDEFAHTNVPGSLRGKRWEDVEFFRDAGIDVWTTMNVQHLESLNDQIWQISGIRVRETIPDWVAQQADETVMIDLTPRALLHRLERGVIYDQEKVERALRNFFRESTLAALRELAFRESAHEIEQRVVKEENGPSSETMFLPNAGNHKILLRVTADPNTAMLIRRARRVGDFLGADCFAVAVYTKKEAGRMTLHDREAIARHLNFARNMRIETKILEGKDPASVLVNFAREHQVTQIFLTRPCARRWLFFRSQEVLQRIVRLAGDMQVVVVSEREPLKE